MTALTLGFGLGFFVAAQVGPVSLLLVRAVLRGALASGLAIGAAAAVIDTTYASLGIAGAAPLLQVDALRVGLGLAGAAVLIALGTRTLWSAFRVRLGGETAEEVATPRRAFLTGLAATASNPLTIASWAAIFAAASTASAVDSTASAGAMLVGVGAGSACWFAVLAVGIAAVRRRVGPRLLRGIEAMAGSGLLAFGGLLGWRAAREG
jgi:putative LysE/RhtB family amino acid efflux pump